MTKKNQEIVNILRKMQTSSISSISSGMGGISAPASGVKLVPAASLSLAAAPNSSSDPPLCELCIERPVSKYCADCNSACVRI